MSGEMGEQAAWAPIMWNESLPMNLPCLLPALLLLMGHGGVHQPWLPPAAPCRLFLVAGIGLRCGSKPVFRGRGILFISASLTLSTGLDSPIAPQEVGAK